MSKTCADCKYHHCSSQCLSNPAHCVGVCLKHCNTKKCFGRVCKDYKMDNFFRCYDSDELL